jgi:exonuclease III
MRHLNSIGTVATLAVLLAACSALPVEKIAAREPVNVRIMTFNIEWGGTHVSFENVVEAIRLADADIVGIQEAEGNLERLADALGWNFDGPNYVISRFPLFDPPGANGRYVLVEIEPGYVIAMANLHLPSDPYGPDFVRDGASLEEVLEVEHATRMPALRPYLDLLPALLHDNVPTFLTGDFNAPTHTDWTEEMVGQRPFLSRAVDWPVSRAATAAGYKDAWRVLFPDVRQHPGLTWWAGRPPLAAYAPGVNDAQDRIDLIWYAGPATPLDAAIAGEPGGPEVSISVTPWPSDHRGVVATFAVEPAPIPALVTTPRHVYHEGDSPRVIYIFPDGAVANIVIRNLDDDRVVAERKSMQRRGQFDVASLPKGHYRISATVGSDNYQREFWVLARDAAPTIEIAGTSFAAADDIVVRWQNAPGNRNDYLAIYSETDATDPEAMVAWAYTAQRPEGSIGLRDFGLQGGWSLASDEGLLFPPGRYIIRLLEDDGYDVLAETPVFEIR